VKYLSNQGGAGNASAKTKYGGEIPHRGRQQRGEAARKENNGDGPMFVGVRDLVGGAIINAFCTNSYTFGTVLTTFSSAYSK